MYIFVGLICNNYITEHGMKKCKQKKIDGLMYFFIASVLYAHAVLAVRKKNDTLHFRLVLWPNGAYLAM